MSVTMRWHRAVEDREAGAVAVLVAISSVVLFGVGALVIDIGQGYARRRAVQTTADLAALAGAAGLPDTTTAFGYAYDYLAKNIPDGDGPAEALPASTSPVWSDDDLANGEVIFSASNTRIRVVVPERRVDFGFAGILGYSSKKVFASATAEIKSPAAAMPFFLAAGQDSGYTCLKDTSPGGGGGGGSPSAMRAALLGPAQPSRPPSISATSPTPLSTAGGETLTVTGDNFRNPAPDVTTVTIDGANVPFTVASRTRIDVTTPAHAAGTATLAVTNAHGTATATLTFATPPPPSAPVVSSVLPASGALTGGTEVTVTGTGFTGVTAVTFGTVPATSFTVDSATTVTATSPPGTGAVHVRVTGPTGTSAETDDDVFTYEIDACEGITGQFGFLDIPRDTEPDPNGANDTVIVNTIKGVDHAWSFFPTAKLPASGEDCVQGSNPIDGAVLDEPPDGVEGANCIDVESGSKTNNVATAFLDGYDHPSGDLDPRLKDPGAGHDTGTLHGRTGMDLDHIQDYLTVPLTTFVAALASGATPVEGWISPEIVQCPRFSVVPIVNFDDDSGNGFYPIVGYRGVYVDGPGPNHGFEPNNTGSQMTSVRAYAFSLDYLPGMISSGTAEGTVAYIGAGPKVPVLVHDAGDPSY